MSEKKRVVHIFTGGRNGTGGVRCDKCKAECQGSSCGNSLAILDAMQRFALAHAECEEDRP